MAWPDDGQGLPVEVWAAFGAEPEGDPGDWTWTNLSARIQPTPIPYRRGASDGAGEVSASSATPVLGNDDGALMPLSATSEYWPNVELGTPIWMPLRRAEDTFGRTVSNGWGTADSGQSWTRDGGLAADFSTNGTSGRHSHSSINILRHTRLAVNLLDVQQMVDVSTSALVTGAALVTGVLARYAGPEYYWCRVEFNSGGTTVMLKVTRERDGVSTELAALNPVPGLAYAANVPLRTRVSVIGDRIAMKVWTASGTEPVGWQLETTDPDPITAPGATGIQSWVVAGNTNVGALVASFDNYTVRVDLLNGFADSWVPTIVPGSDRQTRSTVRLTASGILRRLGQGQNPLASALRRKILSLTEIVVGYWSLEGGRDQREAPSTLPGGQPLLPIGTVEPHFGEIDGPGGSDTLPDLTSHGVLVGPVPKYTHTGEWQVEVWFRTETGDSLDFTASVPLQWDTPGGTVVAWDVLLFIGQGAFNPGLGNIRFDISGYTAPVGGGQPSEDDRLDVDDSIIDIRPSTQGSWHQLQVCAEQVTTTIELSAYLNGHLLGQQVIAAHTLGPVTRVTVNPLQGTGAYAGVDGIGLSSVGHVVVYNTINDPVTYQAGLGYPGETATDRIARLCTEEGIPATVPDVGSERMGPQGLDTLLELLRQCERTDMGLLHERGWGLGYRPRDGRYNQDPKLVVDLGTYRRSEGTAQDQVVSPVYDDQGIRNVWKVSRRNGLSVTVSDAAHVARHGTRDDSVELDVAADDVLPHHASWRVHLGTWKEMRYPDISVDLAANPALIDDWLNLQVGDRAQQISPPAPHPPEDVDQIVGGMSGILAPSAWSGQVTGTPARPWTVGVIEDPVLGRADTDGTQLRAQLVSGTDTTAAVVVTAGPSWITTANQASMFPFDVRSGGVVLRVLASGEVLNSNPWFETDASGWQAAAGATIGHSTAQARSGTGSMLITPDGVTAVVGATVTQATAATVSAGVDYLIAGWLRSSGSVSDARMAIDWYQSNGSTFISSTLPTSISLPAGVWTHYTAVVSSPALAARARLRVRLAGTPTGSVRADECVLIPTGTYTGPSDNFNRTVGAGSWGTATTGQAWSVGAGTASEYSVSGTVGRMALVSVNDLHVVTVDTGSTDHDPISRLTLPVVPTGASITLRQYARWSDASNHYFAELSIQTDAVPMLRLYRRVATVATAIGGPVQLTPLHTAGAAWWVQCSAIGSTIRARAWLGGQPEARGWHITATDTALTSATRAGPGARREASNSNGSQTIDVENFAVPALHVFTIDATPVNGATKAIPAGSPISLATPWRAAL